MKQNYVICSPWKNRSSYLRIMLATLKESMRGRHDIRVRLFDNESTELLPQIASEFSDLNNNVLKCDNCHFVFVKMFDEIFKSTDAEYLVNIDSDCCVHPGFIDAVERMIADLPDLGHASLYSEGNHPEPTEVVKGIYHRRRHISMTASIVSRKAWEEFPKPVTMNDVRFGCIDGHFSTWVHETNGKHGCYSTIRSYVDHIGSVGAYSHLSEDGASSAHRARRFIP